MKFTLSYQSLYELGPKDNQEDSMYPKFGSNHPETLFVVCDGMGGHERGEIASGVVCEALSRYVKTHCNPQETFEEKDFQAALTEAYDSLDVRDKGEDKKMGTTMTFLKFHEGGCFAAHIGDSRIYHIRPSEAGDGRIRYVSRDHSLVNDLLAVGELTPEEAQDFKYKNIITRSMQPKLERRPKAEIRNITDIQSGDYFLLCTDGVLDTITDSELVSVISDRKLSDREKMNRILILSKNSHDNHSAHLIHVEKASGKLMKNRKLKIAAMALVSACVLAVAGYFIVQTISGYRVMKAVNRDQAQYESIIRQIDSITDVSKQTHKPMLLEKWNLYMRASVIEERYEGTEYAIYFTEGAIEKADKIWLQIERIRNVFQNAPRHREKMKKDKSNNNNLN